jgi:hypothetical protein
VVLAFLLIFRGKRVPSMKKISRREYNSCLEKIKKYIGSFYDRGNPFFWTIAAAFLSYSARFSVNSFATSKIKQMQKKE